MSQQPLGPTFQSKYDVPAIVREALERNNIFTVSQWATRASIGEMTMRDHLRGVSGSTELQSLLKAAYITDIPVDVLATLCANSSPEVVVAFIKKRLGEKRVSVRSFNRNASSRWTTNPQFEQIKTYYRIYTACLGISLSVVASLLLPEFSCQRVLTTETYDGTLNSSDFHKSADGKQLPLDKSYGKAA